MSDYQEIFEDPTLAEDDLPAFANEENRKLNGIVKVKEQKLEEIASALEVFLFCLFIIYLFYKVSIKCIFFQLFLYFFCN